MASELTKPFEEKMKKTLTALDSDYGTIRAGRANPHVLDKIMVEYYGTPTPLNQVGNITVPELVCCRFSLGCIPAEGNRKSNQYVRVGY